MLKALGKLWTWFQIALLIFGALYVTGGMENFHNIPGLILFYGAGALVLVGWLALVAVHEAGHAIAAWMGGWKIAVIGVGGLTIWPGQRRIRFGLPAFPGMGGAVIPVPPDGEVWRLGYILMLLGGPVANLISGLCLATSVVILPPSIFWSHYLSALAALSLYMFFLNLLPLTNQQYKFDGKRIVMALQGHDLEPWARLVRLCADQVVPKRPRDWNSHYIDAVLQDYVAGKGEGGIGLALCQYYLDIDEIDKARAALAWADERMGEIDAIKITRAILLAYIDGDAEGAATLLARIKRKQLKKQPGYLIAQAVVAKLTDDAGFSAAIDRAKAAVKRAPFATVADFEFLENLASKAHQGGRGHLVTAGP